MGNSVCKSLFRAINQTDWRKTLASGMRESHGVGTVSRSERNMALKGFPVESGSSAVFRMDSPHTAKQEAPRLRNRPVPPEFSGRLLRLRQLTFVICDHSEANVRKISDTTALRPEN